MKSTKKSRRRAVGIAVSTVVSVFLLASFAFAETEYEKAAEKWAEKLQPSAISKDAQTKELKWFANVSKPFRGMKIKSVGASIKTHKWESDVLTKAFEEITGIHVDFDVIGEGDLVEKLQTQTATGRRIYDIYINDADLVGTHLRNLDCVNLTEYMNGEGKDVTNPMLHLEDFLNLEFGQDYDGNQLQLLETQFANLYWFRYDWFTNPKYKKMFKEKYGYKLGVPVNWAAYEDIANFWTNDVKYINGVRVYGHWDYGKKGPSLGWRFTDSWLSQAGVGDKGLPNGLPVDEWGIRAENRIPVGSMVERGGALNSPAAYYALRKYVEWLKKYAPPYAASMDFFEATKVPARGNIAQCIFKYTNGIGGPYTDPKSPVTDENGYPLWRLAPTPHGKYWDEGMKAGYQDSGAWTIPIMITGQRRKAGWLWAQFCVSLTVRLKSFLIGTCPIRKSTFYADYWKEHDGELGGLAAFYRSPVYKLWTDTGKNVPAYPLLAEQWWKQIGLAVTGEKTPEQAMNDLAAIQDKLMGKLRLPKYSPKLNPLRSREYWLSQPGSPKPERPEEKPKTVSYDELIKEWKEGVKKPDYLNHYPFTCGYGS